MAHSLLSRALLSLAATALLLSGCGTAPVMESPSQIRDLDVLYAKAREAYRASDYYLAAERLIVLARRGDARGQYALGYLYYEGQGVLGDRSRAMDLFRLAAAQGNPKAIRALELLAGRDGAQPAPLMAPRAGSEADARPLRAPVDEAAAVPMVESAPPVEPPDEAVVPPEPLVSEPEPPTAQIEPPVSTVPPADTPAIAAPETTSEPQPPAISSSEPFSPQWLREQDAAHYTIQLLAGGSRRALQAFAQQQQLAAPVGVVETRYDGATWYVVLYGVFADLAQARDALSALPEELRSSRPWIRPLRDVLASLPDA